MEPEFGSEPLYNLVRAADGRPSHGLDPMMDWQAIESRYYHPTFRRLPVTLVRGRGTRVWDDQGKSYLDFAAGIAVSTLGHGDSELTRAVSQQVEALAHTSNMFYTIPQLEVAQRLVDSSELDRVFFVNSGGEASETCIKIARKWGRANRDGAYEIITADHSFHGRTLATTAATGTPAYQEPFAPMPDGFSHVPFNDLDAVEDSISPATAAVMVEPMQGEGGMWPALPEYVRGLRQVCDAHGVLLILDEVQTGVGRTGRLFGYEHFDVVPDVISLAKGLGGGLPIGAVLSTEAASVLEPGDHGSTFGGNPVACAAARVVLDRVTTGGFLDDVTAKGKHVMSRLRMKSSHGLVIKDVRGLGLMIGFDMDSEAAADHVVAGAREKGVLLIKAGSSTVRLVPPLTVTLDELNEGLDVIDEARRD